MSSNVRRCCGCMPVPSGFWVVRNLQLPSVDVLTADAETWHAANALCESNFRAGGKGARYLLTFLIQFNTPN